MILLHLGDLHPYEQALALALAFGPFLVLAVVVAVRRRQAIAEEEQEAAAAGQGTNAADGAEGVSPCAGSGGPSEGRTSP